MLDIYNYTDPVNFISAFINMKKADNPEFTLRNFCSSLELKSTAPLIDILKRKKKLKRKLAARIAEVCEIDAAEKMYFEAIIAKTHADTDEKMRMYDLLIQELSPVDNKESTSFKTSELDIFSHWIYCAIISLSELPDFEMTVKNIKKRLIEDVEDEKVEKALFELFQYGLLVTDENGHVNKKYLRITTKSDISHKNVKHYYELVCDLAKKAIDTPLDKREYSTFSFPIADENIPLAKEVIRKCRNNLTKISDMKSGDQIYQANLMLFPLTKVAEE